MIVFQNITLAGVDNVPFLSNFSATIKRKEKVALVGASGSGKSSLLRSVVGAFSSLQGRVAVENLELSPINIKSIRACCSYIPQEPRLPDLQVVGFLRSFFEGVGLVWNETLQQRVAGICDQILLPSNIFQLDCRKLSGGQRQRVVIAAVVALGRDIILADEITSALDKKSKEQVLNLLFTADKTILSVSHDPDWCAKCDRVIDISPFSKLP